MPRLTPRPVFLSCPIVLLCLTAAAAGPAFAQVTVDLHALDASPGTAGSPPEATTPTHKPVPHKVPPHRTATRPPAKHPGSPTEQGATQPRGTHPGTTQPGTTQPGTTQPGTTQPGAKPPPAALAAPAPPKLIAPAAPPAPAPPAAVIGVAPPPVPVIPPVAPPDAPMAPVPPPPISAKAATTVDALPQKDGKGVRLDFATGESDLTQGTADAVKALVDAAPKDDATTFNVLAYATGIPEDPSTARRLSLSRALSVRSALMAYGVPTTHIYVRALGAQAGDGPADRVDVMVMGANASAPSPGAPAGATPGDTGTRTP